MNQLPNAFALARLWLAHIDPAAPAAALILSVFCFVWVLRRFPKVWGVVEASVPFASKLDPGPILTVVWKSWQALPGALFGAAVAALSSGASVSVALSGVGAAAVASLSHELMKVYDGAAASKKAPGSGPMLAALSVALAMSVSGCSLFGSHGSVWPALGACAPTPADLFGKVESILTAQTGDYEKDLEALGKNEGYAFVECAAQAVVDALTSKASVTQDEAAGVARGKAFLAKVAAQ